MSRASRERAASGLVGAAPSPARRARKGDPAFGPLCGCGGPKAKQALQCQPCSETRRGFRSVPLREQNRRWRQRWLGIVGSVGDPDRGLIYLSAQLEQARAAATGELADLIAEQHRDETTGHRAGSRWVVSLDSTDRLGRPLYELVAA